MLIVTKGEFVCKVLKTLLFRLTIWQIRRYQCRYQSKCNPHVLCCSLLLLTAAVHCCSRTVLLTATAHYCFPMLLFTTAHVLLLLTATAHYCFPMLLFTTAHVLLLLTATAPRAGEPRSTNGINLTKNSPGPRVPSTSSCTKGNPFLHHSYFRSTSDRLNTTDNQPQLSNKNAEERLTIFCFIYTIRRTGFPPKDVCQIVSRNKSKTWGAWGK